jgi:tetrahydromethanopterin S-methyltransferase subunit G
MYRMTWTDERMDDFAAHTDRRFDAVDKRLDKLERRVEDGFDRVDRRFGQVEDRFHGLHQMIHRTMLQVGAGLIVTVAIGFAGIIVTQL